MRTESWWSAIFVRPFQDKTLWLWALMPVVLASIATGLGVVVTSAVARLHPQGLMSLLLHLSPVVANGITFTNQAGVTVSFGISGWAVVVYLALVFGFFLIGRQTQDKRNVAGAIIPVSVYLVIPLVLMMMLLWVDRAGLAHQVQQTSQPVAQTGNALADVLNNMDRQFEQLDAVVAQSFRWTSMRWGASFLLLLFMVGLTSTSAVLWLAWQRVGDNFSTYAYAEEPLSVQSSAIAGSRPPIDLSKVKIPPRPNTKPWKPSVIPQHGGAAAAMATTTHGATTVGAAQALALNGLAQRKASAEQQVASSPSQVQYCPFCGKRLALLADGQYQCKLEGWPKKQGCDKVFNLCLGEDPSVLCERCSHPLFISEVAVTRCCHNCQFQQSVGHGGPWAAELASLSDNTVGV